MPGAPQYRCMQCRQGAYLNQVKKHGQNKDKFFVSCKNNKDGNKCGFTWIGYDEPQEGDDIEGFEPWTVEEQVGRKRAAPMKIKSVPPPAKRVATASKTTSSKPTKSEDHVTKSQMIDLLKTFQEALVGYLEERFGPSSGDQEENNDIDDQQNQEQSE